MSARLLQGSPRSSAFKADGRVGGQKCLFQHRARQQCRTLRLAPCKALDIDWTSADTLIGLAGAVLGIGLGIGVPVFYISRDSKDREALENVRELNRKRFAETGEYMTKEEIAAIRQPRWTDNREFQDDD